MKVSSPNSNPKGASKSSSFVSAKVSSTPKKAYLLNSDRIMKTSPNHNEFENYFKHQLKKITRFSEQAESPKVALSFSQSEKKFKSTSFRQKTPIKSKEPE